jgi:16S rRNA (uracil1498-N3)-methyltransferase
MTVSTTPPVFFADELPDGEEFVLAGAEGHHAATVRRLRPGEKLVVCDGNGGRAHCVVRAVRRDELELAVTSRCLDEPAQPRVVLAQALLKGDAGELAVRLATEAGVDEILPWRARRSVAHWEEGPRGEKALARWRASASSAAKQARRSRLPPVTEPVTTSELCERTRADATLLLHEDAAYALADVELPDAGDLLVVVGPEGGVDPAELEALSAAGARPAALGPTVLRACTAGTVALGAIGARTERWRKPRY